MLRDVFYYGKKPNVHPREQYAENLHDARLKATTRDFWIINEFCDYRNFDWDFDFEFLPDEDVWAEDHNNVWPSQHQKDSGTWLCPKEHSDLIIYRCDVDPVIRKNEKQSENWVELDLIDHTKFDFSWHPDPTDPPFIYKWGCKFFPAEIKHVLEYVVSGATQTKYMNSIVELLPQTDLWVEHQEIDKHKFDMSWRPDPLDNSYIYVWGNKYIDGKLKPTLEYRTPGATDIKYMPELLEVLPEWDRWEILHPVVKSSFDFSWRPDPREPDYNYVFGNNQYSAELMPTIIYKMPNATQNKYVSDVVAKLDTNMTNWVIPDNLDTSGFDFSWVPNPHDPPYIYEFATQWQDNGGPQYIVEGAKEKKYVNVQKAKRLPTVEGWEVFGNYNISGFDFSWHPDNTATPYIYIFGNQWYDAEIMPTLKYAVEGATEIKYINEIKATLGEDRTNWVLYELIDESQFDFSWKPNPHDPPYIYRWGNKYVSNEFKPTIEYHVPGATDIKYMDNNVVMVPEIDRWHVLHDVVEESFDFCWRPDPREPALIYVFGSTQYRPEIFPVIEYRMPGATERKYVTDASAKLKPKRENFKTLYPILEDKFDFSWRPDPTDPPYIYVFGNNQYSAEEMPTVEYHVEGATEVKYVDDIIAYLAPNMTNWDVPKNIDTGSFDFSWVPHPKSPPYIYEFATIWNDRGGPRYVVPDATEYFYIEDIKAKTLPSRTNWEVPNDIDVRKFDFSWVPHPQAPSYIYQFGTKLDNNDGPRYVTPGNNGEVVYLERVELSGSSDINVGQYYIETTLEDLINQHPNEIFWALRKNIEYIEFDFSWRPTTVEVAYELDYVHVFGSPESELTQTYFVSAEHYLKGKTEFKFIEDLQLNEDTLAKLFKKPDMFFIDKSNVESQARFEKLKERFPNIQKTRYLNSWVDTINRCSKKATTELIWILNSELDYSEFEFNYYPNPWQMKMVHVFGTQWSHWGTTFLVNTETFAEDTKYIKIIEHLSNLNFVKSLRAKAVDCVYDVVMIDHGNKETTDICNQIDNKIGDNDIIIVNYNDSYLTTLKNVIGTLPVKKEHFVWVCSSVCDYSNFDFTYICDPFTRDNLHVFPSGKQKFGDTFLMNVNRTRELIDSITELGEYDQVNYNQTMRVNRLEAPTLVTNHDTLVDAIKDSILDIDFPYATLVTAGNTDLEPAEYEPLNLWSRETKNIIVTSSGATRIIIPKQAKDYISYELYDYPYIKRAPKLVKSNPLDIVYLSNGETGAEENYQHLLNITENLPNRVVRVDGVNGRAAAYHAAAEASNTPWFFTVFAKLEVNPKFDWSWQPDRMQVAKHYIFNAKNPVNGLIYGHQAMIAYNKKLTLANQGRGLDFTLDDEHEVVPLLSGTARYNTDSFSTWRTAFREAIKLRQGNDDDSRERLEAWLTKAEGDYAEYSIKGAQDAMSYYDSVDGDFDKLKLSYEWAWLKDYFNKS